MLHLEAIKHTVPLLSTHDSACAVKGDPHFSLTLSWWVPEWSRSLPRFTGLKPVSRQIPIRQKNSWLSDKITTWFCHFISWWKCIENSTMNWINWLHFNWTKNGKVTKYSGENQSLIVPHVLVENKTLQTLHSLCTISFTIPIPSLTDTNLHFTSGNESKYLLSLLTIVTTGSHWLEKHSI